MIQDEVKSVEFIAVNTDKQALNYSQATHKILIGDNITHGRGAGANPEVGRRAAEESKDQIQEALKGTEMVFITAGMGGGTGTGAAPLVAQIAKEMGVLTVGIVTKPFGFEGTRKMAQAERGIEELLKHVDSLVVIPNERLKLVADNKITLANAFEMADGILRQGVQSITDLIKSHGFINLDFADVSAIMKDAGYAHMCVASAKGKDKSEAVARAAITSPLLETSIAGAKGIILNFTADPEVILDDIYRAADIIREEAHPDTEIIWGVILDESLEDELKITVIATGFDKDIIGKPFETNVPRKTTTEDLGTQFRSFTTTPLKSQVEVVPEKQKKDEPDYYTPSSTPRTGVQKPNQTNSAPTVKTKKIQEPTFDDEDSDENFLKLLNEITKNK
jgi:cell division protein FtsZ